MSGHNPKLVYIFLHFSLKQIAKKITRDRFPSMGIPCDDDRKAGQYVNAAIISLVCPPPIVRPTRCAFSNTPYYVRVKLYCVRRRTTIRGWPTSRGWNSGWVTKSYNFCLRRFECFIWVFSTDEIRMPVHISIDYWVWSGGSLKFEKKSIHYLPGPDIGTRIYLVSSICGSIRQ